ncbi:hypothetical protein I4Q36_04935 [Tuanshanicoccus lijuaniae]|uniref:hypothetical protein n=1 Tax=Aerococcaceae bacterium zg-1292 TaxID=2774330 RepID=UPI0019370231|nr:hypothetical protein [Aerococcaceae bacterium zg-1292]QQA38022.1 hypothetical protein I4Q36_04935 [Aerococcaceae bacterium zg-1292]
MSNKIIPLISFWPKIFEQIIDQRKLIEYRRNFPQNCDYAYMYISKPIKSICGIIYFNKKHSLKDWKAQYENDDLVSKRIAKYSENYRYAVEIKGIQKIKPISLKQLQNNFPNFRAPQSYILLNNFPDIQDFIEDNTILVGNKIINALDEIYPEHICKELN